MIEIQNCNVKQELVSAIGNLRANKTSENIKVLKDTMEKYNLHVVDGKIVPNMSADFEKQINFTGEK